MWITLILQSSLQTQIYRQLLKIGRQTDYVSLLELKYDEEIQIVVLILKALNNQGGNGKIDIWWALGR